MKGIKLTERIRYMHCQDEDGAHGVLVLLGKGEYPTKAVDIENKADFRLFYDSFVATEKAQEERMNPLLALEAV